MRPALLIALVVTLAGTPRPLEITGPVAVFDLDDETSTLPALTVKKLSARARARLVHKGLRLVPHASLKAKIDRLAPGRACKDLGCQTEVASELGAAAIVRTRVVPVVDGCEIYVGVHRLNEPPLVSTASAAGGCHPKELRKLMTRAVDRLVPLR
ncbi:MAG: hypothetical protein HYV07_21955 [Deltaproteobacteria bacterium]|nr:hypothetical protein [Deltaproteobacteria bacterium]